MNDPTYEELLNRIKFLEKEESARKQIEDALREKKNNHRSLTENLPLGIFRSTPGETGEVIEVNHALVKMFGYENKEEVYGTDINQFFQNPRERLTYSQKLSKDGFVHNEELHLIKKDGTPIIVSETAIAVKDDNGKILYFDGILEDITERKKAEEELHVQKTHFEKLFNSAPEAIALHDNNDLIVDINDEFTRLFGYTREEAIGKPIDDLLAPDELKEEAADISKRVMSGEKIDSDSKRKCKDGSLVDVSILGAPIIYNGKQIGDYAIYRDITRRKKVEEEIIIQKAYFEKLFNSAPEAIILHDTDDKIVSVNEEFTKLFGYTKEEAIGNKINDLVAPKEFINSAKELSKKVTSGERVEADSVRRKKDGSLFDVWILGAPIFHNGKQVGIYAIYRDITDRKKAEEARIRSQEEARMAKDIQLNLLPKSNPETINYDIAGTSIPAQNVGGDYYDFIKIDENRLAICLGDVSGKGLAAALVMSNLQAIIRGQSFAKVSVNECLRRANQQLYHSTDLKTFASLFYAILNFQDHTLEYANAGQNTPIIFSSSGESRQLKTRGLALGLSEDASYEKETIKLDTGERLLIYSDGITEAMDAKMKIFGDEKLCSIIKTHNNKSGVDLINKVIETVQKHFGDHPQNDDMTLVFASRK